MYALVDCNNFFVSCERAFQPQLEGKPVVVLSNNDGCVVARSNESKAMGIQMGTPYFKIKILHEEGRLEVRSSNYALYGDLSSRVMTILSDAAPKIEIYSIDEAFLVMDGIETQKIVQMCRDLVRKIRKWVGIPVSIGIAPTKTLAKIASHFAKKYPGYRGVCLIDSDEKRLKALELTPIGDVWGIGRKLNVKMQQCSIFSARDFIERPGKWVHERFTIHGYRTWQELRGIPAVAEELPDRRQSICTSRSFAQMIQSQEELSEKVADFAAQCAKKLRIEQSAASRVTVFLWTNRFRDDLGQYYPSITINLAVPANSTHEIAQTAISAMKMIYRPGYQYKKAGVIVEGIVSVDEIQNVLFDFDEDLRRRQDALSQVMDRINAQVSKQGGTRGKPVQGVRLASQSPVNFSDSIRSEFTSRRFTTDFNEILEIR